MTDLIMVEKITNLLDGTELWKNGEDEYILTLGYYADITEMIIYNSTDEYDDILVKNMDLSYGNNQNIITACKYGHNNFVKILTKHSLERRSLDA